MESKLITGNTWFAGLARRNDVRAISFEVWRRGVLRRLFERFRIKEGELDKKAKPLVAFVNHGAWMVACPDCQGAEYAWEEGVFFCCSCKNSSLGHRYRRSKFPAVRVRIEELLAVRPLANRNWTPDETIADLERENMEHATELLPVGEGG